MLGLKLDHVSKRGPQLVWETYPTWDLQNARLWRRGRQGDCLIATEGVRTTRSTHFTLCSTGPNYSGQSSQYHGFWCPGSLRRQIIFSHVIDFRRWISPCLPRRTFNHLSRPALVIMADAADLMPCGGQSISNLSVSCLSTYSSSYILLF